MLSDTERKIGVLRIGFYRLLEKLQKIERHELTNVRRAISICQEAIATEIHSLEGPGDEEIEKAIETKNVTDLEILLAGVKGFLITVTK